MMLSDVQLFCVKFILNLRLRNFGPTERSDLNYVFLFQSTFSHHLCLFSVYGIWIFVVGTICKGREEVATVQGESRSICETGTAV